MQLRTENAAWVRRESGDAAGAAPAAAAGAAEEFSHLV